MLDDQRTTEIVKVLDEMKIVGVRPKFKYKDQLLLTPDLKVKQIPELQQNPREFNAAMAKLQSELSKRGFNFIKNPDLTLVSNGGELSIGTDEGVVYSLSFGKFVEGDESAIEIGSSGEGADDGSKEAESTDSADDGSKDQTESGEAEPASAESDPATVDDDPTAETPAEPEAKNRYLMIRVSFDESLLGDKPVKPTEPTKPTNQRAIRRPRKRRQTLMLPLHQQLTKRIRKTRLLKKMRLLKLTNKKNAIRLLSLMTKPCRCTSSK